jgi:hypothetical protein
LEVLHRLVEQGNTVVVIEHNLDVIKTADWVLDLGPGGGVNGGEIVVEGTPEAVAACDASFTGQYLRPLLERHNPSPLEGEGDSPSGEPGEGPLQKKPPSKTEDASRRTKPRRSSRAKSRDAEQKEMVTAK